MASRHAKLIAVVVVQYGHTNNVMIIVIHNVITQLLSTVVACVLILLPLDAQYSW